MRWLVVLAMLAMAPDCNSPARAEDNVQLPFSLEYRVHLGLDCYQRGNCGFRVEVSPEGGITLYEDRGRWQHAGTDTLSQAQADDLLALLEAAGFRDYPAALPGDERTAGGKTVMIKVTYVADGATKVVEASLDDTSHPFPEGFLTFEYQLRTLLLNAVSTAGGSSD